MVLRQGSRGAFLGCTGYPKCRNLLPVDDQGRPVQPVKVEVPCTKCGGADGRAARPARFVPRLYELSQMPGHRAHPRRPQGQARRTGRSRGGTRGRPESDPHRGNVRAMRRPDARPPQPPRLFPGLRPVSAVQGNETARRGHARQDHRGRRAPDGPAARRKDRRPGTEFRVTLAASDWAAGDRRPTAMA